METYREHLYNQFPIFSTRLVRETEFEYNDREVLTCPEDVGNLLRDYYQDKDREEFIAVFLDTAKTAIGMAQISVGGLNSTIVEPRQVFKAALLANADCIIVAHNHPSGRPDPSTEDIRITKKLAEAGKVLGINVLDHILIADQETVSFREHALM